MEYKLGNSKYVKSRGDTLETICPCCKNKVNFGVFSNYDRKLVPNITLIDCTRVFFLVCPECTAIYTVDEELGNDFIKGNKFAITDTDLKPLRIYKNGKVEDNE